MLDLLKYWAKESLGQYGEEIDNELKMIMQEDLKNESLFNIPEILNNIQEILWFS